MKRAEFSMAQRQVCSRPGNSAPKPIHDWFARKNPERRRRRDVGPVGYRIGTLVTLEQNQQTTDERPYKGTDDERKHGGLPAKKRANASHEFHISKAHRFAWQHHVVRH